MSWQTEAIETLSPIFKKDPDVRAMLICGSLAVVEIEADEWSDVDAKLILADEAYERYYQTTNWLEPLGQVIGLERHTGHKTCTLRVCLAQFHRFDFTFIAESILESSSLVDLGLFTPFDKVLWSTLPHLEKLIASSPPPKAYQPPTNEQLEQIVEAFWFKTAVAIAKIVRNDLLIATHLAFDLARDGLLLQMIRRDIEKQTNIHRTGGWGNELVSRYTLDNKEKSAVELLHFIRQCGTIFDELASKIVPNYTLREPSLLPTIDAALSTVFDK